MAERTLFVLRETEAGGQTRELELMGDDESFQKWIVVRSDGHDVTIRFELPDELQRKLRDALEGAAW